jgi:hypothetical protein
VLEKFLDASLKGRPEEAYSYLSQPDRTTRDIAEYKGDIANNLLAAAIADKVSYVIQDIKVDGEKAVASVKITRPDVSLLAGAFLGAVFSSAFEGLDAKTTQQKLAEKISKEGLLSVSATETFNLVRESDGWKVFMNWERQKKLLGAMAEVAKFREERNFAAALAKLDEVIKIKSDFAEAKNERSEIEKEGAEFREKQAYINKIKLYDLKARYHGTYTKKTDPGVEFKLKNIGTRTLGRVEITVYFKNKSGDTIYEKDFNLAFSLSDQKPLKPGYIWQVGPGSFYSAKHVPEEWDEGSVTAKIADIEFQ